MEKNPEYREFWGNDESDDMVQRDGPEETFVCSAFQRTIFPNIAKNIFDQWKYIVNQPKGHYKQGILIETCVS